MFQIIFDPDLTVPVVCLADGANTRMVVGPQFRALTSGQQLLLADRCYRDATSEAQVIFFDFRQRIAV